MKKITLLILTIAFSSVYLTAQENIGKGTKMIGGNASGSLQYGGSFSMSLFPKAGIFLTDNFVLGTELNLGLHLDNGKPDYSLGASPFARMYMNSAKARPFIQTSLGYNMYNSHSIFTDTRTVNNYLTAGIGPGVTWFVNDHVGLEGILLLDMWSDTDYIATKIVMQFGIQVLLPGKKSDQ